MGSFSKTKAKGKVLPVLNEALRYGDVCGSGCIHPHFLNLGTSWRRVLSFKLDSFTPGKTALGTHCTAG